MCRRINPVEKFIAIDQTRILDSDIVWASTRRNDDVVCLNFPLLLVSGRNSDAMLIDQRPATERHPDAKPFQVVLEFLRQPRSPPVALSSTASPNQ